MASIDLSSNKSIISKQNRLEQYGYSAEPEQNLIEKLLNLKPDRSIFENVFSNLLPRSESASASLVGGLLKGEDIGTSLSNAKESFKGNKKYSYHDMLGEAGVTGISQDIGGFGLGTALDPLTYISLGSLVKVGKKIPVLKQVLGLGDDAIKATKRAMGFKTMGSIGEKNLFTKLQGASGGVNFLAEANFKKYEPLIKQISLLGDDQMKFVGRAIEKPGTYLKKLDDAGLSAYNGLKVMLGETGIKKKGAGLVKELIGFGGVDDLAKGAPEGYLPRYFTDKFREISAKLGKTPEEAFETLRGLSKKTMPGVEKTRKTGDQTLANLNRLFFNKYKTNIFETDLKKITNKYIYNYSKNTALLDINKQLLKLTDDAGNPLIKSFKGNNIPDGMQKLGGLPYKKGFITTPQIAQQINKTVGVLSSDVTLNKVLKAFDKTQNFWKRAVTAWNPSFHVNNLLGGTFNNYIKNANSLSPQVYTETMESLMKYKKGGAMELVSNAGEKISSKNLLDSFKKGGAFANFVSPDQMMKKEGIYSKATNRVGSSVEDILRTQLGIAEWKKTGSIDDAIRAIWEVHGNYNSEALSTFERGVVKRAAPFYIWAKTNIPFQIKNLVNKTGKYAQLARVQNTIVSPEERANLPEWMRGSSLGPIKTLADGTKSARTFNLPVGDLNDIFNPAKLIGGRLTPPLKATIEGMTNKNLFYDSPIVNTQLPMNMRKGPAPELASVLPQFMKNAIGYQESPKISEATGKETTKKEMNAYLSYIINTFGGPTTRYANFPKAIKDEQTIGGLSSNRMAAILSAMIIPAKTRNWNPADVELSNQKNQAAQLQARIQYLIDRKIIPKLK